MFGRLFKLLQFKRIVSILFYTILYEQSVINKKDN